MQDLATIKCKACGRLVGLRRLLWVVLSAYGLAITYFSHHFAPLAWVALIPFFLVIRESKRLAAVGHSLLWGAVFFGFYGFVKQGTFSATIPEFALVGVLALAMLTLCLTLARRRFAVSLVALAIAWLVYEVIRIELVLHSGILATSGSLDGSIVKVVAISGLSGLTFLIVVVNVCLMLLWDWARVNRKSRARRDWCEQPPRVVPYGVVPVVMRCYFFPEERGPP